MDRIPEVGAADLRAALDRVEGKRPALRLVAAIAYKNGVTQTELASWFGVERKTIYNWLERLEPADLAASVADDARPGRQRKLDDAQLERVRTTITQPPRAAGFEAPTWTSALVQRYLRDTFAVEYSRSSCRRLMREAGLEFQPSGTQQTRDQDGAPRTGSGRWVPATRS